MKAFGISGFSGSGKTTLIEQLIPRFQQDGYTVSAIKHTHHGFDLDRPGKDSHRMRSAGCGEVLLVGDRRLALLQEYQQDCQPSLPQLLARLSPCDLVLVEGYQHSNLPQLRLHRSCQLELPDLSNPAIVAVASDVELNCIQPWLPLADVTTIYGFLQDHLFGASRLNVDLVPTYCWA
ncbi:MAG: molybdopterin-guanine dinucleotide biosynthesis protein B [Herbaspirillum sp.]